MTSSAQTHYALRVLRCHGLNTATLQHVYRATVVARLTYAASAWRGFSKASERQRIDLVMDRADALDITRRIRRRSMTCATTRTMSYSARLVSGRTTYCTLCCRSHPPRHNDTTSDNELTYCSCLSIRLSCLTVIFWYACCTKTLTNSVLTHIPHTCWPALCHAY